MSKTISQRCAKFAVPLSLLCGVLFLAGCGGKFPEVSGKVTYDGEPVANLKVVFTPIGGEQNPVPGPFSIGVTDESGVYSLQTRRKDRGAVVGSHRVGFEWDDISADEVDFLKDRITREKNATKKGKLTEELRSAKETLKSRPKISRTIEFQFEVPAEGTSSADFELVK